ncbi:MAG: nitroreductase family deazaflavin-dependent oxidoreductase [Actinomycetota bacterium]
MPLTAEYERGTADWANQQIDLYESTDGREGNDLRGRPVIILYSIGAKSGKLRKTPLMRVEHDGEYVVVASKGGAEKNPTWYYNLKANPHVELRDLAEVNDFTATELDGADYDLWWQRAVDTWPDYQKYTEKTDRKIPLFLLEPVGQQPVA